jgi:xylose dehydrogenase (NAD/NADP)
MESRRRLKWGVLGLAKIARLRLIPAIQHSRNGRVLAVASRSDTRAGEVAGALRVPRSYGNYQALLEDREVEAVYIPLPNSLHREWTIRAAEAGKHVLCEKPLACNAKDAVAMVAACRANGVQLMEAFMYRFHPGVLEALRLIQAGAVGRVRLVKAAFSFAAPYPGDIRWRADLGGGALLDSGCYGVDACRAILGDPAWVRADAVFGANGVIETVVGVLRYDGGPLGVIDGSIGMAPQRSIEVVGTEGRLALRFTPRPGWGTPRLELHSERGVQPKRLGRANHYRSMVEGFSDAVLQELPAPLPPEEAIGNIRVLDALHEALLTRGETLLAPGVAAK